MALRDYVARRLVTAFVTFLLVVIANFFIFKMMPGDPMLWYMQAIRQQHQQMPPEELEKLKAQIAELFGFNRPLHEQFFIYLTSLFTFDFKISITMELGKPVIDIIAERLPLTILLLTPAYAIAIWVGMRLGAEAAWRRGKKFDVAAVAISLFFYSMPIYWLGVMLQIIVAPTGWPIAGTLDWSYWQGLGATSGEKTFLQQFVDILAYDPLGAIVDLISHILLPVITLVVYMYGGYFLVMRNTMLDILTQDYVTTARAIGHDDGTVLHHHAKRNAMLPMITIIVLAFAGIFSGAVLTETIFSWQGMGRLIFDAINARDYPVIEACFFIMALLVVVANLIADIVYGFLDPRIRY